MYKSACFTPSYSFQNTFLITTKICVSISSSSHVESHISKYPDVPKPPQIWLQLNGTHYPPFKFYAVFCLCLHK